MSSISRLPELVEPEEAVLVPSFLVCWMITSTSWLVLCQTSALVAGEKLRRTHMGKTPSHARSRLGQPVEGRWVDGVDGWTGGRVDDDASEQREAREATCTPQRRQ